MPNELAFVPPIGYDKKYIYVEPPVIQNKILIRRSVAGENNNVTIYTAPLNKFFYCVGITVCAGTAGNLVGIVLPDSIPGTPQFLTTTGGMSLSLYPLPLFILSPGQSVKTYAGAPNQNSTTIIGYEE